MAVAGFTLNDLSITAEGESLVVNGQIDEKPHESVTYLHRGIAARPFQRSFRLADHIKVTGAEMQDGLLIISLVREIPEEKKPRMIEIKSAGPSMKAIENNQKG